MRFAVTAVLGLAMAAAALAGCAQDALPAPPVDSAAGDLLAGPALWPDPQNTPHTLWGWPTLSHPPANVTLPPYWEPMPAAPLPATVSGLEHVSQAPDIQVGAGVALFGSLAVLPGFGEPTHVVDLSDPAAPVVLSTIDETAHRGAAIIAYPWGGLAAVLSTGDGIDVWNITDPLAPEQASYIEPSQGGHKLGVVPGTPIVYNAASWGGPGSVTEIYDLTDPENPVHVQDFPNGYSCHHVFFWEGPERHRAVCAGLEATQIWDTADPRNPVVIATIPFVPGEAGFGISHFANLNLDGSILVVGDESFRCGGVGDTPVGSVGAPLGALWFYDISDEANPVLVGWYSPPYDYEATAAAQSFCTSHHGRLIPVEGKDLIAMSFYNAGVVVVDFTDPSRPMRVAQFAEGTNTWETWYHNGWIVTGDLARGLDVLRIV